MLRKETHIVPRRFGRFLAAAALVCIAVPTPPARAESGPSIVLTGMQKAPGYFRFQAQISQGKLPVGNGVFNKVYVRLRNGPGDPVAREEFTGITVRDGVLNLEVGQTSAANFEQAIANNPQLQVEVCIENTTNCMKPVPIASVPYAIKASYAYNARYAQNAAYASECNYTHRAAGEDVTWTGKDGEGIGYLDFTSPIPPSATGTPAAVAGLNINPTTNKAGYIQWMSMDPAKHELHLCGIQAGARKPLDLLVMHAGLARFSGNVQVTGDVGGATATFRTGLTVGSASTGGSATTRIYGSTTFGAAATSDPTTFNGPVTFNASVTLRPGSIIAADSVNSAAIVSGSIVSSDIAPETILGTNIYNGTITADDIANGTVTGTDIADGTIQGADMAPATIRAENIERAAVRVEHLDRDSVTPYALRTTDAGLSSPATATKANSAALPTWATQPPLCILRYEVDLGTGAYCRVIFDASAWRYSLVAYRAECNWACF